MDMIRRQAELAAQGKEFGVRELPPRIEAEKAAPKKVAAAAGDAEGGEEMDPEKARRIRKREEAMERLRARRAAQGGN